jgi:carbamoyl-phosphate synthase large subunit
MRRGEIRLVINTPTSSSGARRDGYMMRRLAIDLGIPFITTIRGAAAAAAAIAEVRSADLAVKSLQAFAAENRLMERSHAA